MIKKNSFLSIGSIFCTISLLAQSPTLTIQNATPQTLTTGDYKARDAVYVRPNITGTKTSPVHLFIDKNIQLDAGPYYQSGGVNYATTQVTSPIDKSLPVGSINGTYDVSSAGQATYNIQFYTPPGTKGIEPKIGISYNSSASDGIAGRGWGITGLSVITRVQQQFYYDYNKKGITFGSADGYALDGVRMIPTGTAGTFRLENENFSLITSNGVAITVKTKEGISYEYGNTTDSKLIVANPVNGQLAWYLNKVYDNYGNYMLYTYNNSGGEVTLKEIKYTGNAGANILPYNSIKFYYDKRTDASTQYLNNNAFASSLILREVEIFCENVAIKRYQFKYGINVQTFLNEIIETGNDYSKLNSTFIKYGDNVTTPVTVTSAFPAGLVANADYRVGDFNGDGKSDLLAFVYSGIDASGIRTYTGAWKLYINVDGTTFNNTANGTIPNLFPYGNFDFINNQSPTPLGLESYDFNGDGKDDMLIGKNNGQISYSVYYSTGNGFSATPANTFYFSAPLQYVIADINGDTKPELVTFNSSGPYFWAYSFDGSFGGGSTSTFYDLNGNILTYVPYNGFTAVDFDGDGVQELSTTRNGAPVVLKLNVSPADPFGVIPQTLLSVKELYNEGYPPQFYYQTYMGDFNGDGITDNVFVNDNYNSNGVGAFLALGTGQQYTAWKPLANTPGFAVPSASHKYTVADINLDGKSDLIYLTANPIDGKTYFNVIYSDQINSNSTVGNISNTYFPQAIDYNFAPQNYPSNYNNVPEFLTGDFDGDGRSDIFFKTTNSGQRAIAYFNKGSNIHLATTISDGYRRQVNFQYTTLAKGSYIKGTTATYPAVDVQPAMYVVNRTTIDNGVGGTNYIDYAYEGASVHLHGKGFLGFNKITSTNPTFSTVTKQEFILNTTYYEKVPLKTQFYELTSVLSKQTDYTTSYSTYITTPFNKEHFTKTDKIISTDFDLGSTATTDFTYDNNGNVLTKITNTKVTSTAAIVETDEESYVIDPTTYLNCSFPAKPSTSYIKMTRPGNPQYIRQTNYAYNTRGDATTITQDPGTTKSLITSNTFDETKTGVLTQQSISSNQTSPTLPSKTTIFGYDAYARFVTSTTNPLNQLSIATYDPKWGKPLTETSPTGLTTSYKYDAFGRTIKVTTPDNLELNTTLAWVQSGEILPDTDPDLDVTNSVYSVTNQKAGSPTTKAYFDIMGRVRKTETDGLSNKVYSVKGYDARGNTALQTNNYETVAGTAYTRVVTKYTYGYLNYLLTSVSNDKTTTLTTYYNYGYPNNGTLYVETHTPDLKTFYKVTDATGLLKSSSDDGGTITYDYYSDRQLKTTTVAGVIANSMEYDAYGRQTKLIEKNSGTTLYTYDAYGQLQAQTDSRSMTYNYTYDVLGRMLTKSGPDGVYNYSYISSGNGLNQLYSQSNPGNVVSYQYTYDNFSRPIEKKETINGQQFTTTLQYDNYSNLIQQTYPGGFAIQNVYNTNGYQTQVKRADNSQTIWQADAMSPLGTHIKYTLGNGLQTQKDYTNFGLPKEFKAGTGTMYDLKFTFDPTNGNLTQRKDVAKNLTEDFTYGTDNLYRLKTSQIGAAVKTVNYTANGNILNKTDYGNYFYSGTKVNAVTSVDNTTGIINAASDQVITYTPFSKTSVITENNDRLQYTYGPDYSRKMAEQYLISTNTKTSTRYYVGDYEKTIDIPTATTTEVNYINGPSGLIGMYVNQNGTSTMYYAYTDHLGSIVTVTNQTGGVVAEQNFDAWGRKRNPTNWTFTAVPTPPAWLYRGYTGHEHLPQFALINMNGRMYDPLIGRMLSPDIVVQAPGNTQNYNRYTYCLNNPLKYTDPSGNTFEGFLKGVVNVLTFPARLITEGVNFTQDKINGQTRTGGYFNKGYLAGNSTPYPINTRNIIYGGYDNSAFFGGVGANPFTDASGDVYELSWSKITWDPMTLTFPGTGNQYTYGKETTTLEWFWKKINAESSGGFNADKAVNWLNNNAHESWKDAKGQCAKYVRLALEAGGLNTAGHPVPAWQYSTFLPKLGFTPVNTTNYMKGDIAVMEGYPGATADPKTGIAYGHIQMFSGTQWISDFKQRDFWPGGGYRKNEPAFEIYRWGTFP